MKKTAKIALREKSSKDLLSHLSKLKADLQDAKLKHHLGQVKDTSVFAKLKAEISLAFAELAKSK